MGTPIGPKNIIFSSRISNNRICIYLSSKAIVDKLINERTPFKINNKILYGRRLITPSQRLVLSNVCPTIPNHILVTELEGKNLSLLSSITYIKINIPDPEYTHVLSFRRQVFISPTEEIPESILINFDDTQYRIFLSTDSQCFKCKQMGHVISQCPNRDDTLRENPMEIPQTLSSNVNTKSNTPSQEQINRMEENSVPHGPNLTDVNTNPKPQGKNAKDHNSQTNKRHVQEILTPPADPNKNPTKEPDIFAKPSNVPKKAKHGNDLAKTPPASDELLLPARNIIESNSPPFVLTFEQLADLFTNIYGSPECINVALNYTSDLAALSYMLEKIYPYLTERSIKTRCTKFKNKIRNYIDGQISDGESDSAQSTISEY